MQTAKTRAEAQPRSVAAAPALHPACQQPSKAFPIDPRPANGRLDGHEGRRHGGCRATAGRVPRGSVLTQTWFSCWWVLVASWRGEGLEDWTEQWLGVPHPRFY